MNTTEIIIKVIEKLPKPEMYYAILLIFLVSISGLVLKAHDRLLQIGFNRNEILITFIIISVIMSYLITKLLIGKKLILSLGIYWDKKCNPYCPIHKTPLAITTDGYITIQKLICTKCNVPINLVGAKGVPINLNQAKEEVRMQNKLTL